MRRQLQAPHLAAALAWAAMLLSPPTPVRAEERPPADLVSEFYETGAVPPAAYAPELAALFAADEALAEREGAGNLDFDWLSGGQDLPRIEDLALETQSLSATGATVRATFRNGGEERVRTFYFIASGDHWLLQDVQLDTPEAMSLSALLAGQ